MKMRYIFMQKTYRILDVLEQIKIKTKRVILTLIY
jgi:hypothetical protein